MANELVIQLDLIDFSRYDCIVSGWILFYIRCSMFKCSSVYASIKQHSKNTSKGNLHPLSTGSLLQLLDQIVMVNYRLYCLFSLTINIKLIDSLMMSYIRLSPIEKMNKCST